LISAIGEAEVVLLDADCPRCETNLRPGPNQRRIVCPRCGSIWLTSQLAGSEDQERPPVPLNEDSSPEAAAESRLADLEEAILQHREEIEALRSRELSSPLQLGCSFFGLFFAVLLVIAVFMLLGRAYFGGWIFYACLTVVILLAVFRIRKRLIKSVPASNLRSDREILEHDLNELEAEHQRISHLLSQFRS